MIQGSLLYLWMHKSSEQHSNLQLLSTGKKLTNVDESTTKLIGIDSAQGTGPTALHR